MENLRVIGGQSPEPIATEGRVPPHDLDAEAAVLSAVMLDPLAFDKVNEFLRPEHFYSEAHRRIHEACVELSAEGKPVDVVQVATWLRDRERLAQVGGMAYLTEVLNAAPAVANVVAYARGHPRENFAVRLASFSRASESRRRATRDMARPSSSSTRPSRPSTTSRAPASRRACTRCGRSCRRPSVA